MAVALRTKSHQRRGGGGVLGNDKALLNIFLAAAFLVAFSILFVPFDIENDNDTIHGIVEVNAPIMSAPPNKQETPPQEKDGKFYLPDSMIRNVQEKQEAPPPEPEPKKPPERKQTTKQDNSKPLQVSEYRPKTHTIVSTGCSTFQDWQSYVFFFHVLKSGQQGDITRIASGCSEENEQTLRNLFAKEIEPMAPGRLHIHFTPEFGNAKPGLKNFKYFNKPMGTRHWFQHALGYPDNHQEHDETVFILMDPDQIMLRPFTGDFTHETELWKLKKGFKLKVEHGSPFSQVYGYGIQWLRKTNPAQVFDGKPTPVANLSREEAFDYYMAMGPPYVATGKDMHAIVETWAEIVPRVHNDYPYLLAEMFAYNLAAAHLGLRHTLAKSFQVSDIWAGGEGWNLLKKVPNEDICHNYPKSQYPHVIHYCQRYYIGKFFIGKYRLRKDFISCEAPLLLRPPDDVAVKYNAAILPDGERKDLKEFVIKQEAFVLCAMIDALNEAAIYYKDHHCDKATANYVYNYTFHEDMTMPENATVKANAT